MQGVTEPWFVADRSEAIAGLLLTSRGDVRILHEQVSGGVIDFFVAVDSGDLRSARQFVIQARGTASRDAQNWIGEIKSLFRSPVTPVYLPTCVFAINVRFNESMYAWVAEPLVMPAGAKLFVHETMDFHPLNPSAIGEILDRVKAWYEALPSQLAVG